VLSLLAVSVIAQQAQQSQSSDISSSGSEPLQQQRHTHRWRRSAGRPQGSGRTSGYHNRVGAGRQYITSPIYEYEDIASIPYGVEPSEFYGSGAGIPYPVPVPVPVPVAAYGSAPSEFGAAMPFAVPVPAYGGNPYGHHSYGPHSSAYQSHQFQQLHHLQQLHELQQLQQQQFSGVSQPSGHYQGLGIPQPLAVHQSAYGSAIVHPTMGVIHQTNQPVHPALAGVAFDQSSGVDPSDYSYSLYQ